MAQKFTKSGASQRGNPTQTITFLGELVQNAQLIWRLMADPRVSLLNKLLMPGLGLAYLLFPIDLLPDIFPGLGQLDDLAIILILMQLFIQFSPKEIVADHRQALRQRTPSPPTGDPESVVDADYQVVNDG